MKKIRKSLKNNMLLMAFLFSLLFVGSALIIAIFGSQIPYISEIIQFWIIITGFIILYSQSYKEKKRAQKHKNDVLKKIIFLIEYIYQNRSNMKWKLVLESPDVASERIPPNEMEDIENFIDFIILHISNMKSLYFEDLLDLDCEILTPKNNLINIFGKYIIGTIGIRRILSENEEEDITNERNKIDLMINEVKDKLY